MTVRAHLLDAVDIPHPVPFPPRVSAFTRPFWENLESGNFTTTQCSACGRLTFPPKPVCRSCWSTELNWVPVDPAGTLYSFTVVHVAPRTFAALAPYAVGVVDLDAGLRIACAITGMPTAEDIGEPVTVVRLRYADGTLFGARLRRAAGDPNG